MLEKARDRENLPPSNPSYTKADDYDVTLASISPLLPTSGFFPISATCASQSMAYLDGLFSNKSEKIWAKKSKS